MIKIEELMAPQFLDSRLVPGKELLADRIRWSPYDEYWRGPLCLKRKQVNDDYRLDVWLGERKIGWIFPPKGKHGQQTWEGVCTLRGLPVEMNGQSLDEVLQRMDTQARGHLTGYYQEVVDSLKKV